MSSFRVAPREAHLDRLRRVCSYLYKFKPGCLRIRTNEPDYSSLPVEEYEWSRTCYCGAKEEIPHDIPTPRKRVVLTSYVDANLLQCGNWEGSYSIHAYGESDSDFMVIPKTGNRRDSNIWLRVCSGTKDDPTEH
jgi:hypothetical protein